MNPKFFRGASLTSTLCLITTAGLAFALAAGCSRSEAAPRPRADESTTSVQGAKFESDNYTAEIVAGGSYTAGVEGTVEVTLTAKGAYHLNKQYPYKFKAADPAPDGVTFSKPVLQRADGKFDDEKKGSFKVPFTVAKAGKATIGGTLHLSVCSDANCLMDKQPLEVSVDVK